MANSTGSKLGDVLRAGAHFLQWRIFWDCIVNRLALCARYDHRHGRIVKILSWTTKHPALIAGLTACSSLASLSAYSSTAHAWGQTAHTIICEIAFQELTDAARTEVKRLIRLDTDYSTFAASCHWADTPRKRPSEHYLNVPRHFTEIRTPRCLQAEKCVLSAIKDDAAVLADANASDQAKLEALKFLGHWVGDVHQPMHVSFADDRGGNRIKEEGPCSRSLHAVWDTCIIEHRLGTDAQSIAAALRAEISDQDRASWTASEPMNWADESYRITISPELGYCVWEHGECSYEADNPAWNEGEAEKSVTVGDVYLANHLPTVKDRLMRAGVRLGHFLSRSLGQ